MNSGHHGPPNQQQYRPPQQAQPPQQGNAGQLVTRISAEEYQQRLAYIQAGQAEAARRIEQARQLDQQMMLMRAQAEIAFHGMSNYDPPLDIPLIPAPQRQQQQQLQPNGNGADYQPVQQPYARIEEVQHSNYSRHLPTPNYPVSGHAHHAPSNNVARNQQAHPQQIPATHQVRYTQAPNGHTNGQYAYYSREERPTPPVNRQEIWQGTQSNAVAQHHANRTQQPVPQPQRVAHAQPPQSHDQSYEQVHYPAPQAALTHSTQVAQQAASVPGPSSILRVPVERPQLPPLLPPLEQQSEIATSGAQVTGEDVTQQPIPATGSSSVAQIPAESSSVVSPQEQQPQINIDAQPGQIRQPTFQEQRRDDQQRLSTSSNRPNEQHGLAEQPKRYTFRLKDKHFEIWVEPSVMQNVGKPGGLSPHQIWSQYHPSVKEIDAAQAIGAPLPNVQSGTAAHTAAPQISTALHPQPPASEPTQAPPQGRSAAVVVDLMAETHVLPSATLPDSAKLEKVSTAPGNTQSELHQQSVAGGSGARVVSGTQTAQGIGRSQAIPQLANSTGANHSGTYQYWNGAYGTSALPVRPAGYPNPVTASSFIPMNPSNSQPANTKLPPVPIPVAPSRPPNSTLGSAILAQLSDDSSDDEPGPSNKRQKMDVVVPVPNPVTITPPAIPPIPVTPQHVLLAPQLGIPAVPQSNTTALTSGSVLIRPTPQASAHEAFVTRSTDHSSRASTSRAGAVPSNQVTPTTFPVSVTLGKRKAVSASVDPRTLAPIVHGSPPKAPLAPNPPIDPASTKLLSQRSQPSIPTTPAPPPLTPNLPVLKPPAPVATPAKKPRPKPGPKSKTKPQLHITPPVVPPAKVENPKQNLPSKLQTKTETELERQFAPPPAQRIQKAAERLDHGWWTKKPLPESALQPSQDTLLPGIAADFKTNPKPPRALSPDVLRPAPGAESSKLSLQVTSPTGKPVQKKGKVLTQTTLALVAGPSGTQGSTKPPEIIDISSDEDTPRPSVPNLPSTPTHKRLVPEVVIVSPKKVSVKHPIRWPKYNKAEVLVPRLDARTKNLHQRMPILERHKELDQVSGEEQQFWLELEGLSLTRGKMKSCCWVGCQAHLDSGERLVRHVRAAHWAGATEEEHFVCRWNACGSELTREELAQHITAHALEHMPCIFDKCAEEYRLYSDLARHVVDDHDYETASLGPEAKPYMVEPLETPRSLPKIVPSYVASSVEVYGAPISQERRDKLGPWVLRNIYGHAEHELADEAGSSGARLGQPLMRQSSMESEDRESGTGLFHVDAREYAFLPSSPSRTVFRAMLASQETTARLRGQWGWGGEVDESGDIRGGD